MCSPCVPTPSNGQNVTSAYIELHHGQPAVKLLKMNYDTISANTAKGANSKEAALLERINWEHPALDATSRSADKTAALLTHLAAPGRQRFRFEYERKAEIIAFLHEHYEAWREFDSAPAQRLETLTIEQAQGPRALMSIPQLGMAWWATGDPRYGAAFERFYRAVSTGEMFNWGAFNGSQGSIELSAWFLLLDCPGFTREGRIAFLEHLCAINDEAWDVHTSQWSQLSLGPEGHNWYLHGMHILPFLGVLFPEFKRADFCLRTGMSVVEEHLRGHYRADGGARETTLGYQNGSLLCLWDFYQLAHRNGVPLSAGFSDRLLNATLFLLRLATPQGCLPSFGDTHQHPGDLTSMAAVAASLTGDGECKWYAEQFRTQMADAKAETPGQLPWCAFWRTGLAGAGTYAATRPRDPHQKSVLLGDTGYAALRQSEDGTGSYLAIAAADRGPIVTSHGHNEVFSLEVHALGQRFIGEMGCAPYGNSPGRDYDQSTAAHTCLAIDGREQAELAGEWRWRGHVIPAVRRWISEESYDFFDGVHEGFYQWPEHQTLHARKVLFFKGEPSYWLVFDWIESNVENPISAYFHGVCPGDIDGDKVVLQASDARLAIVPPEAAGLTLERVSAPGLTAYIEEKQLDAEAYPAFAFRKSITSDCLVWALVPLRPGEAAPQVQRLPIQLNGETMPGDRAIAVEVQFGGHTDHVMLSHTGFDAELTADLHSAWGFLSFQRSNGGTTIQTTQRVSDGVCGR